jgi:hypothetical protein
LRTENCDGASSGQSLVSEAVVLRRMLRGGG